MKLNQLDAKGEFTKNSENTEKQKEVKKAKKNKKPGFFAKIGAKIKDIFAELKKVSWPSFGKVIKQTGVVIAVVVVFLVILTAFDFGLSELLKLITP
ncbi:MAG: preprotein translocase subunit SecE [Clostridiales bacterium]|nr:preprotein translocase subunit SecE [Clostridiales bacterium]